MFSVVFFQHKHGQIAAQRATSRSLIKYAYDVTWLTRRARRIHISSQITVMAKRGSGGKTCAAGAPGQISCTNNSYSSGISMHIFPKNEKVRAQWVKFVRTHRPDWEPTEYSYLCSLHFNESCFTRLRLSTLMPAETSEENGESSGPSNKRFQEKRVLSKGSVPTIHCANKAPERKEPSDRDRRRSNAVSVQSSYCVFNFHNKPVMFVFGSFSGSF